MRRGDFDVDPYILVRMIWTFVSNKFKVFVGYEPQWYLKDPPAFLIPVVEDFGLVDVDPALLYVVSHSPAPLVKSIGDNEVIDPTSDTGSEIE
ncbi:hypothetical protein CJ030_MR2G001319 [Morella rubra]|uniref:Uncharacterized protein n=1 Tax=Morella rubra TaxID=262757 RepID=A0A6A1WFM1_9ROSI|nr:hypothetical protein CJ030_MR2G001319 [Morella rubra]